MNEEFIEVLYSLDPLAMNVNPSSQSPIPVVEAVVDLLERLSVLSSS